MISGGSICSIRLSNPLSSSGGRFLPAEGPVQPAAMLHRSFAAKNAAQDDNLFLRIRLWILLRGLPRLLLILRNFFSLIENLYV